MGFVQLLFKELDNLWSYPETSVRVKSWAQSRWEKKKVGCKYRESIRTDVVELRIWETGTSHWAPFVQACLETLKRQMDSRCQGGGGRLTASFRIEKSIPERQYQMTETIKQFTPLLVTDASKDPINTKGWVMGLVVHPNSSIMRVRLAREHPMPMNAGMEQP
ncbi:hypothetical protein AAES_151618 [Amazona aestiva]|uniref:Uncharacterized protein n=1 Tax=Amazona aestiva TaxID=12930 RepID=A0A0Q3PF50_AMAAE|nr:hypothetical protein AAES_151618 [Amazona aestiva]